MVCNRIYVNREVKTFKWKPKKEKELVKHRKSEEEQKRSTFCPSLDIFEKLKENYEARVNGDRKNRLG